MVSGLYGHKRAADVMNWADECGIITVVKVFQFRKSSFHPEYEKKKKESRKGGRKSRGREGDMPRRSTNRETGTVCFKHICFVCF